MPRDIPIGNGDLLITFDRLYRIRDLYYPQVGRYNHTSGHVQRFGIWVNVHQLCPYLCRRVRRVKAFGQCSCYPAIQLHFSRWVRFEFSTPAQINYQILMPGGPFE